jgi:hypothetical protein
VDADQRDEASHEHPEGLLRIDGKAVRRSRDRGAGLGALHLVSA